MKMVVKKKVCKNCGRITGDDVCVCKSNQFVEKYKGTAVILNAKESEIAKKLEISDNGTYAIKY